MNHDGTYPPQFLADLRAVDYSRERAKIDLLREGYAARCREFGSSAPGAQGMAASAFPYPKVTRPRVVKAFRGEYKVEHGRMFTRADRSCVWQECQHSAADFQRYYITLLDLINNPTEEEKAKEPEVAPSGWAYERSTAAAVRITCKGQYIGSATVNSEAIPPIDREFVAALMGGGK
jgi:hypothetical protein